MWWRLRDLYRAYREADMSERGNETWRQVRILEDELDRLREELLAQTNRAVAMNDENARLREELNVKLKQTEVLRENLRVELAGKWRAQDEQAALAKYEKPRLFKSDKNGFGPESPGFYEEKK